MNQLQATIGESWAIFLSDAGGHESDELTFMGDSADIEASIRGDENAYARLVETYQPEIARMMWKFSRNEIVHRELTQEVFVKAYFGLKNYRGKAPFSHWLRRIATHIGYDYWRKRTRETARLEMIHNEMTVLNQQDQSDCDAEVAGDLLYGLLQQLSPRNRIVLTLLYWENYSVVETSKALGWSQSMVKVQAFRARAKLKNLLKGIKHE